MAIDCIWGTGGGADVVGAIVVVGANDVVVEVDVVVAVVVVVAATSVVEVDVIVDAGTGSAVVRVPWELELLSEGADVVRAESGSVEFGTNT